MSNHRTIPIRECGEPLVPILADIFHLVDPPPYVAAGAIYPEGVTPWVLRHSVLAALRRVQERLTAARSGHRLSIFDAYRPNSVQSYMFDREMRLAMDKADVDPAQASESEKASAFQVANRLWAVPSDDPARPPPHSTGAAIDLTIVDSQGREIAMGSPIDENSDRSYPDYFKDAQDAGGREAHANRRFLKDLMVAEGFCPLRSEWWHFSLGDQYWAWRAREVCPLSRVNAIYGRADLVEKSGLA